MKLTAILICCNENLIIRAQLAHIYSHFDRIIICDGPSAPAKGQAGGDGRRITRGRPTSTDGTIESIRSFKKQVDKDEKIILLTKSVPWKGKLEKFNEALRHCDEGYVWEIDCDEFYLEEDMRKIRRMLESRPDITSMSFFARHFWGDPFHHFEIKPGAWGNLTPWTRIFKFVRGNRYINHEPPVMSMGARGVEVSREAMEKEGVYLFHFGYVHATQLERRELFYNIPGKILPEWLAWQINKKENVSGGRLVEYDGPMPIDVSFLVGKKRELCTT